MTDGRYDSRRSQHESRGRSFDQPGRDDRGFIDRARDEVSSWFGDDDAERRRERDSVSDDSRFGRERGYDRYEQNPRYRDEGYRRPYTGRSAGSSGGGFGGSEPERGFGDRMRDLGSSQSGLLGASTGASMGRHDRDYSQWRSRQIDELDRDYDDFRRENQSRFDSEFSTWRGERQAKRQLLGHVSEHMDVVGSDDQPIGKVDWIKGDMIILTKHDSADGRHHAIGCGQVDRIEDGKVILSQSAEEVKRSFTRADRDPAMFGRERDREREEGPHMLNRSFSNTY